MSEYTEFEGTESIGSEGRTDGGDKSGKLKVKHQAENLKFQMALDYLQQVLETAKEGNFVVETDGKSVNLAPAEAVDLAIKAKDKGGRQSLSFELTWDKESKPTTEEATELGGEQVEGDVCMANRMRGVELEAGDYDDLERRFELELFGGCGCVAIPGA
jgi:amphi-Trp domain-containing protein